ncbi:MAG: Gfo/Idh/MocA family oxidoreductase [Rhodobiaceae bacterium]|nr:Gfo/Idh/MocA family oxidoreductase [Rhodobiaceae bacterium]
MAERVVRVGLLGASQIAPLAIIAPAAKRDDVEVVSVAARDQERAAGFAAEHGIARVASTYEELVSDPEIDLIYNGLPPVSHAPLSVAALKAGRHVLCEKPFAMNASEARHMVEVALQTGRLCVEGFHYFYHPLFVRVLEIVRSGKLGPLVAMSAAFDVEIPDVAGNIRHDLALGGGALMDLGCYPLHMLRHIAGSEPQVLSASAKVGRPGIDLSMDAELQFSGIPARISCDMSTGVAIRAEFEVIGQKGRLHVNNPIHPYLGHQLSLVVDGDERTEQVEGQSTFDHQLDSVVQAIRGGPAPHTGGADAVANMEAIDAIYTAAGLSPRGV